MPSHRPAALRRATGARPARAVAAGLAAALALGGCASLAPSTASSTDPSPTSGGSDPGGSCAAAPIEVVAGESSWGSLAAQLGGRYARVTSLVNNPAADPHDYEATPDDGRAVARAGYVIANGLGYDPWLTKLIDANPDPRRVTLDVGQAVGHHDGDNPHRWYFPDDVNTVVDRITADYEKLAPDAAQCFVQLKNEYQTQSSNRYHRLIAQLAQDHRGAPIGGSESIVEGLAAAGGLDLVTPRGFLDAISEGTEPSSQDKATVDAQIDGHQIEAFVFNRQNATPDVQKVVDRARSAGIPVVDVTETLDPAGATFQDWQADQLQRLLDALAAGGPG